MADEKNISKDIEGKATNLVDKIKALVKEGNVSLIRLKKGDKVVLEIPMTVGVAGAFMGVAAAPWAAILGAIAMIGLDCKVEVVKKSGEITILKTKEEEQAEEETAECACSDAPECETAEAVCEAADEVCEAAVEVCDAADEAADAECDAADEVCDADEV